MRKGKIYFRAFVFICAVTVLSVCLSLITYGASELPEDFFELTDGIPEELLGYLPDGMLSDDGEAVGDALTELTDSRNIFAVLSDILKKEAGISIFSTGVLCEAVRAVDIKCRIQCPYAIGFR